MCILYIYTHRFMNAITNKWDEKLSQEKRERDRLVKRKEIERGRHRDKKDIRIRESHEREEKYYRD